MMSLTFGLFTQVSGSGPLGPLVIQLFSCRQQERIASEREEIEKQRKLLLKRKPTQTMTKNSKDNFLKPGGEKL